MRRTQKICNIWLVYYVLPGKLMLDIPGKSILGLSGIGYPQSGRKDARLGAVPWPD
jgi:hypothetical protein